MVDLGVRGLFWLSAGCSSVAFWMDCSQSLNSIMNIILQSGCPIVLMYFIYSANCIGVAIAILLNLPCEKMI